MPTTIPDAYTDLMQPETKAFALLATAHKDGRPHVTPV
jgi:predicted pyridoxine 5'-phosphate oxidase superfamily flavin-nucleotide-binding protein